MTARRVSCWVAIAILVLALSACFGTNPPRTVLRVLASSELTDMQPILDDLRADTGIGLAMEYRGTGSSSRSTTRVRCAASESRHCETPRRPQRCRQVRSREVLAVLPGRKVHRHPVRWPDPRPAGLHRQRTERSGGAAGVPRYRDIRRQHSGLVHTGLCLRNGQGVAQRRPSAANLDRIDDRWRE
jgi:hypothetical protein